MLSCSLTRFALKGLKFYFCLVLAIGFLGLYVTVERSSSLTKKTPTECCDVIGEHTGRDVEIDRRSIVAAAREMLQGRESEVQNPRHAICPIFAGGLGNMIFQYASAYGIGRTVGLKVIVKADSKMFQIFDIWAEVSSEKTVCSKAKIISEEKSGVYEASLVAVRPDADYIPRLYLQSWKYFEPYKVEIRKQFRFRGDIEKKAYDILSVELSNKYGKENYSSRTLVGVHVRRGDLLDEDHIKYGFKAATRSYIKKALKYFRLKYNQVTFLVCSNDMKWSKANVTGNDVIYIENHPAEVDLALLSSLNHTIVTVGTYGWWAGWLANGTTLYYKNFVRNGTVLATQFKPGRKDHIYPGWIGM